MKYHLNGAEWRMPDIPALAGAEAGGWHKFET